MRREVIIRARFSADEAGMLAALSKLECRKVSEMLREVVRREALRQRVWPIVNESERLREGQAAG